MNRYFLIHRLRGPAFLLLLGVVALLHKLGLIEHWWSYFWALSLILWGVLMLAERAALSGREVPRGPFAPDPFTPGPFTPSPFPSGPIPSAAHPGTAPSAAASTAIVPAQPEPRDTTRDTEGGQL